MSENKTRLSRRHFLLSLGASGAAGAAAVAAVTAGAGVPAVDQAAKAVASGERADASAHMRNYYRTARV